MALINWDDSLSVSVIEIDQQHKKLVSLINELNQAMLEKKTKDVLGKIIDELIKYTASHFSVEEKYFDQFKYAGTAIHKKEHNDFVEKMIDVKKKFDSGQLMLSMELMKFLKDWLQNHIKGTDKKYSQFFNDHGLK